MRKVASLRDLHVELDGLIRFAGTGRPTRLVLAVLLKDLARRVAAHIPYDVGDVVEHVEGRIRRHIYVEAAHYTGGNYSVGVSGRVLWSQADDVGRYVDLDDEGIVANHGKSGGPAKAQKAIAGGKIREYERELRAWGWDAAMVDGLLTFRYTPNAFSSHLSLRVTVKDSATLLDQRGSVKCRMSFVAKNTGVKVNKAYMAKTVPEFRAVLRAAEAVWFEHAAP